jgi:hypothetical protein
MPKPSLLLCKNQFYELLSTETIKITNHAKSYQQIEIIFKDWLFISIITGNSIGSLTLLRNWNANCVEYVSLMYKKSLVIWIYRGKVSKDST